jgi:hypothetical protein
LVAAGAELWLGLPSAEIALHDDGVGGDEYYGDEMRGE